MSQCFLTYGRVLKSNISLPELPSRTAEADWDFQLLEAPPAEVEHQWIHHWTFRRADGQEAVWLNIAELRDGQYLLRFPQFADFRLSVDGRQIRCQPRIGVADVTLRHLLLDQVLPLALSMAGRCVLHAAAVVLPSGDAIAFAAESGAGKSTLTAALLQAGCQLLTDDGLLLDVVNGRLHAVASYPGVRLWRDSTQQLFGDAPQTAEYADYTRKQRLVLDQSLVPSDSPSATLRGIYFLGRPDVGGPIEIVACPPREAFLELVRHAFTLKVRDSRSLAGGFRQFTELSALPIYSRLSYRRSWEELPGVVAAILKHSSSRS